MAPTEVPAWLVVLATLFGSAVWLVAVLGNVLVVTVIKRSRRLQSTTNFFVVSLAFSDITTSVFCLPLFIVATATQSWYFGSFMCQFSRFIQVATLSSVVAVILCISVDRFYTIIYPLSFKITRSKAKKLIACSWAVSFILGSPCFYFFKFSEHSDQACYQYFLRSNQISSVEYVFAVIYIYSVTFLVMILPGVVISLTYTRIFRYIWVFNCQKRTFQRTANTVPRSKVKNVKMLMIVSVSTFILWIPYFFLLLLEVSVESISIPPALWLAGTWIAFAVCALKPTLYLVYNSNFRRGCKEVFCLSSQKCYRKETYAITHATRLARKHRVGTISSNIEFVSNGEPQKVSTYESFDREGKGDKNISWPLSSGTTSTYL
ncbi:putative G-protein coupled receptor 19 [Holothuria leucospilota]|uniref:G-protein coupled receptor 19 n=1 Tax=Holothuria leucospilota TaxID=206669 RepID=A0A9Q1BFY3_HOLLE|nr:putative G-protein coupled receptor 19 [Holothuria leucospilota]